MKQTRIMLCSFWLLLLLSALACNAIQPSVPEVVPEDVPEQTGAIAATAAAIAEQAGAAAATAAAGTSGGSSALATAQAFAPDALEEELAKLRERFESAELGENGQATVTITDEEVNQLLQLQETFNPSPTRLQDAELTFTSGTILLTGNMTVPVSGVLTVEFRPYVEENALQLEVLSATFGQFSVPAVVLDGAESTINGSVGQLLNQLPSNMQLLSLTVDNGEMIVVVGRMAP